jgi:iron(III) transport system ATP-binding protein
VRLGLKSGDAARPDPSARLDEPAPPRAAITPGAAPAAVRIEALTVRYGAVVALDDVSLTTTRGEVLCLLGPSGSGKSTLLRCVAGVERPASGRIVIEDLEVTGPGRFVEPERRRTGMVFQDYALFPHLTIAANVAFGLRGRSRADVQRRVGDWLERVGLTRHARSYPHMLSGGERQRVALARAMAPEPRVLLMDEPFSSLDGRLRDEVRSRTLGLLRETATTTIVVTHDPGEAMRIADRIALLHEGRLVQCGAPDDVYGHPATLFAARFFSDVNEIPGRCRGGYVDTPLGRFAAPHLADDTTARVCIRPQHLRVAPAGTGPAARVLRREFLGEVEQLALAVDGLDTPLTLRAFGRTGARPDDTVHLDVHHAGIMVLNNGALR